MNKASLQLFASLAAVPAALLLAPAQNASAYTYKTVFAFCGTGCKHATAMSPSGGLIADAGGDLYGVALNNAVYELLPNASKTKWKYKALHNFSNGKDGGGPYGVLVMDTVGDLYGTTNAGGASGGGTVFEIVPNSLHTKWHLTTLYHFCAKLDCEDGNSPRVGLTYAGAQTGALYDGTSPLYGTTVGGGSEGCGVVFQLASDSGKWREKVIHSFDGRVTPNDGCNPNSVIEDSEGDLVGTTQLGSPESSIAGSAFRLVPNRARTKWTEHVLADFECTGDQCPSGASPWGNVTMAGSNLYGTTITGGTGAGTNCAVTNGGVSCGVAFKIAANGTYSKIYDFCSLANCADGASPRTTLLADEAEDLFGVTQDSGPGIQYENNGTVFEIDNAGHEQILHAFCTPNCSNDGRLPNQDLYMDAAGDIFGTTSSGDGSGTVFELTP
jgi:uncharacterized repeat protein (TIGR03803 family)